MFPILFASFWHYFFGITIFVTSVFLVLLVLVQRGRGGGLTGALGGMGGQSAFGAKAGDVFTRITMVTALIWIVLCMGAIKVLSSQRQYVPGGDGAGQDADTGDKATDDAAKPDPGTSPDGGDAAGSPSGGEAKDGAGDGATPSGPAESSTPSQER